ncbi:putative oxidoreductase [Propionibacterium cyclohexanicum]|uniref:Putative oxidoreductase n=1 Tax=Propionibacterium cyclohexanicum TaxID=64702 RepID=A0A1H9RYD7_9ACTN|nr:DoxX family protein [Propionibacterium cyclohexanicum]SER77684.1 putative oxidoreductase [Propionibacterium cyclohexanicum]
MTTFMNVVHDIGLLVARVTLGLALIAHGWARWDIHGMDAEVLLLTEHGVPAPELMAWGALVFEVAGGVMLIFGILTRLVAIIAIAQNVLIVVWLRFRWGPYLSSGGYEYNVVLATVAFVLLCFGAGRTGVDMLFEKDRSTTESEGFDSLVPPS